MFICGDKLNWSNLMKYILKLKEQINSNFLIISIVFTVAAKWNKITPFVVPSNKNM